MKGGIYFFMKELTEQEREQIKQQAKVAAKKSGKIVKNFTIYLATFASETRRQVSKLTKDEYEKMQKQKYIGSKHEDVFFVDLPETDIYVETKTMVLNKDNFALGFHPMVWKVLSLEERVALCRIARQELVGKDFKEFCCYDSNGVVMVGKDYQGSLNVGAFVDDEVLGNEVFIKIANGETTIKHSYYMNKLTSGKYHFDKITDFSSFEEMQYLSPLDPIHTELEQMSDKEKAYFFDQIYRRRYRAAEQRALDLIAEHASQLEELYPEFFEYMNNEQKNITATILLVMQEIGSSVKTRDETYLDIKVKIFNNGYIDEYNKGVIEYNKLLEKYKNPSDILEQMDTKQEIAKMEIELDKLKSNIITLLDAKDHFSEHFYPKQKTTSKFTVSKITDEKLN